VFGVCPLLQSQITQPPAISADQDMSERKISLCSAVKLTVAGTILLPVAENRRLGNFEEILFRRQLLREISPPPPPESIVA
jgi:hypothetical protein